MRKRWKIMGGTGLVAACALAITIGHSRNVRGDDSSTSSVGTTPSNSSVAPASLHNPTTPYDLGPHAISYEELTAVEQAAVDVVQETVETSQPPSSYATVSAGVAHLRKRAEAERAARSVGLIGTSEDGVVEP